MTREELTKKVKEEFDQYYDENDAYTLQFLWIIEAIDPDHPMHEAMEISYEVKEQLEAVKAGLLPNW